MGKYSVVSRFKDMGGRYHLAIENNSSGDVISMVFNKKPTVEMVKSRVDQYNEEKTYDEVNQTLIREEIRTLKEQRDRIIERYNYLQTLLND